jgi:hypothetical protein
MQIDASAKPSLKPFLELSPEAIALTRPFSIQWFPGRFHWILMQSGVEPHGNINYSTVPNLHLETGASATFRKLN